MVCYWLVRNIEDKADIKPDRFSDVGFGAVPRTGGLGRDEVEGIGIDLFKSFGYFSLGVSTEDF